MSKRSGFWGTVPDPKFTMEMMARAWDAEEDLTITGDVDLTSGVIDSDSNHPRANYYAIIIWNLSDTTTITVKYTRIGFSGAVKTAVINPGSYMRVMPLSAIKVADTTSNAFIKVCYKDRHVFDGTGPAAAA